VKQEIASGKISRKKERYTVAFMGLLGELPTLLNTVVGGGIANGGIWGRGMGIIGN